MNTTPIPALFSVLFSVTNESQATLCLKGHCEHFDQVTIVHEGQYGIKDHPMAGDGVITALPVEQRDAVIILVRTSKGVIVGCGLYEVQFDLVEVYGSILAPKTCANIIIDQCDAGIVERGNLRSLEALFAEPETATV